MVKAVKEIIDGIGGDRTTNAKSSRRASLAAAEDAATYTALNRDELGRRLKRLEKKMHAHARNLEFEQAAAMRDQILLIREVMLERVGEVMPRRKSGAGK